MDWTDLFTLLAKHTSQGRHIVLLDEISWMGSKDPSFLGKLKTAWDLQLKINPKFILILCGSVSSWIEANLIRDTGFLGRFTLKMNLEELSYQESMLFLAQLGFRGSVYEKLILLAITGGVPRYLELIYPSLSATENVRKLCFEPDGILVDEFQSIFHDLFGRKGSIYQKMTKALVQGPLEYAEIAKKVGYPSSGPFSQYLSDLVMSGYLSEDLLWSLKSGKDSRLSRFRLRDNYLRFYLKYIEPNLNKIKKGNFKYLSMASLPGWEATLGLQFENLVLNNRTLIHQQLEIRPEEIVNDHPYFQRATKRKPGCQIDYLIQMKYQRLYLCEIKFSKNPISFQVIHEVKEKIKCLTLPRGFSCIPILICASGVTAEVEEGEFFAKIIDFSQLVE